MPVYRTRAIVLRSMNLSDTDKLVTFFTEDFGKIKIAAKAARRIKSRFGGVLEPLSHVSLIFFGKENQDIYRLNQCDIIQSFQSVREDLDRFFTAVYFLELAESMIPEAHPEPEIYQLLTGSLNATNRGTELETLCRLFELRIMTLAGYGPSLGHCIQCQQPPQNHWVGFNYQKHGIVCRSCIDVEFSGARIQMGTLNYLKKLQTMDLMRSDRLKFPKGIEGEIELITHRLVLSRLGRELKSYPFIKQMAAV